MMDIKGGLFLWFINFCDKTSAGSGVNMHTDNESPLDVAEKLHKPIIKKFIKRTV